MKVNVWLVLLCVSTSVFADSACKGKIEYTGVGRGGAVLVKGPGELPATYLCSVESKMNNVEPNACRAVYSTLLAAKMADKEVSITFNPEISSCESVKAWGWAENFNWIFQIK